MQFKIENGPVFTSLRVQLGAGESIKAEAGAMVSMSNTLELQSKATGKGVFGTLKAAVGGEALFASLYTASGGAGELLLAPPVPGDILKIDLSGSTLFAQGGAYLAGSPELELSTKGSFKAMFSGEGLFLQVISGTGTLFLSSYGSILEKSLASGENYIVDTGHIIAFEESVQYKLKKAAKGIFSTLASGEGLVCEYSGPGKLWIQTRNLKGFASLITKLAPRSS
ncbi:MAG: TIGR00266 family protein [Spirochaetales bacterium]|nr:TIGR00266 family protein [Spirochaetales bacterium]